MKDSLSSTNALFLMYNILTVAPYIQHDIYILQIRDRNLRSHIGKSPNSLVRNVVGRICFHSFCLSILENIYIRHWRDRKSSCFDIRICSDILDPRVLLDMLWKKKAITSTRILQNNNKTKRIRRLNINSKKYYMKK